MYYDVERRLELSKSLGLSNFRFTKGHKLSFVHFDCQDRRVRCCYGSYYDPAALPNVLIDDVLVTENLIAFRYKGSPIASLSAPSLYRSEVLMKFSREILIGFREWQLLVDRARRDVVTLVRTCSSFEEACELLTRHPKLYAGAFYPKKYWGYIWGQTSRYRSSFEAARAARDIENRAIEAVW